MSDTTAKKPRRLRQASETMRERAERGAGQTSRKERRVLVPFRSVGNLFKRLGSWKIWRPFRAVGRFIGRIIFPRFLRSSFRELRNVTWPTRRQTLQLTTAVILFSIVFGMVVGVFDLGLDKLFKQVILR